MQELNLSTDDLFLNAALNFYSELNLGVFSTQGVPVPTEAPRVSLVADPEDQEEKSVSLLLIPFPFTFLNLL